MFKGANHGIYTHYNIPGVIFKQNSSLSLWVFTAETPKFEFPGFCCIIKKIQKCFPRYQSPEILTGPIVCSPVLKLITTHSTFLACCSLKMVTRYLPKTSKPTESLVIKSCFHTQKWKFWGNVIVLVLKSKVISHFSGILQLH